MRVPALRPPSLIGSRSLGHVARTTKSLSGSSIRTLPTRSPIEHLISSSSDYLWLYDDHGSQIRPHPKRSNEALLTLVSVGRFGAADRLRLQLLENGVEITPDMVYEKAVVGALLWRDNDACLAQLSVWLSLVPDKKDLNTLAHPSPLRDMRNALLRSGSPSQRLPVVIHFSLLCAAKGYASEILRDVLPVVARFATPSIGAKFLLDIEAAVTGYDLDRHPERATATARYYRISSIEICCQAGWLDEAVKILQMDRDFDIPQKTYEFLLLTCQSNSSPRNIQIVKDLWLRERRQREMGVRWFPTVTSNKLLHRTTPFHHTPSLSAPVLSILNLRDRQTVRHDSAVTPLALRGTIASQLKGLNWLLKSGEVPKRSVLLRFMIDYGCARPSRRALEILRKRALVHSRQCAFAWLITEMKYYDGEANYERVVSIFAANFASSILPGAFSHTLSRLVKLDTQRRLINHALLKDDIWVILNSIIRLSADLPWPLPTIQTLYASFRTFCSSAFLKGSAPAFASFIWAFGKCGSPQTAFSVLRDMRTFGKSPDRRHYDMLAVVYAEVGDVPQVMEVLDKLESGYYGNSEMKEFHTGKNIGLLQPALLVEKRMMRWLDYQVGQNEKLDAVLYSLRALEKDCADK